MNSKKYAVMPKLPIAMSSVMSCWLAIINRILPVALTGRVLIFTGNICPIVTPATFSFT